MRRFVVHPELELLFHLQLILLRLDKRAPIYERLRMERNRLAEKFGLFELIR